MSSLPMKRDDVIRAIERGEDFGRAAQEAEKSALRDLLTEIQNNLG